MIRNKVRSLLLTALLLAAGAPLLAQHGGGGGGGGGMGDHGGMGGGQGGPPFGSGSNPFPGTMDSRGAMDPRGTMDPRGIDPRSTMPGGINPNANRLPPGPTRSTASTNSTMRGGLQLGPPGRFWDDKGFAKNLGLRKDQQKKMDAIFDASRAMIVESYRSLQVEEKRLERITQERPLDESRVFAGIDAVVQARGTLEKAQAHLLLQIRREMDSDQVTRMDKYREEPVIEGQ